MLDFIKFKRSHKSSKSSGDALADTLQNLQISGNRTSRKTGRGDTSKVANHVARLTVTPPKGNSLMGRAHSDQLWVGEPPSASMNLHERPPYPAQAYSAPFMQMPTPGLYPAQPPGSFETPPGPPIAMPIPTHMNEPMSLTMQRAVINTIDPGPWAYDTHQPYLSPRAPAIPTRPYSDPTVPTTTSISASGPSTPPRRRQNSSHQEPQSVPRKFTKANLNALDTNSSKPKRRRAASTPPTPISVSVSGLTPGGSQQCSGYTQKGKRCGNRVTKLKSDLAKLDPDLDEDIERYCHLHVPDVLSGSLTYLRGKCITFAEWIPAYLQPATIAALRIAMTSAPSDKETPGYIYTFEIIDTNKTQVHFKVGRTVSLNKRIKEWSKQCGSKEQVLRGFWPGHSNDISLLMGTVNPGVPGPLNHKLERLIHLELADIMNNTPYLETSWPNSIRPPLPNEKVVPREPCLDCGKRHKEIFTLRHMKGPKEGKEYDELVKPIIDKWGRYVDEYFGDGAS
ncbi:hypothetical protein EUX98_g7125 [Antrodiella citrinella]|uniref:DUF1766-domain-containing protein n=1 Tax=Antrodiella citrinella TaxID=2447956 RepID=A0A4S4MUP3_9APHY|nr:hypothetical protein EUX98_g7125 [Antrodiella citrinella]